MKTCKQCGHANPWQAKYCMYCGTKLADETFGEPVNNHQGRANCNLFWLTLGGSLLLTWIMVVVFHLPIFFLGALLPLIWFSRKK